MPLRSSQFPLALSIALLTAACQSDEDNHHPVVSLTSHLTGHTVDAGETVFLRAVVQDDDGLDETQLSWFVEGEQVCKGVTPDAGGAVTCEAAFAGGGQVLVMVRDAAGGAADAEVTLDVRFRQAPAAAFSAQDAVLYSDHPVLVSAVVSDPEDAASDLLLEWEVDGLSDVVSASTMTENGTATVLAALPEGKHLIHLRVTDTDGNISGASTLLDVSGPNDVPTCGIVTAPPSVPPGEEAVVTASVGDADVGMGSLQVLWSSDVDGELAVVAPTSVGHTTLVTDELTRGAHLLSATVTDEMGATCTTEATVVIGNAPQIVISAPDDNSSLLAEDLFVVVNVQDEGHSSEDLTVVCESDAGPPLDSVRGTDGDLRLYVGDLEPGQQKISVRVTNPDGLTDTADITLTVL